MTETFLDDTVFWWMFCGPDEGEAKVLGPFPSEEALEDDLVLAAVGPFRCEHAHTRFTATPAKIAVSLRSRVHAVPLALRDNDGETLIGLSPRHRDLFPILRRIADLTNEGLAS